MKPIQEKFAGLLGKRWLTPLLLAALLVAALLLSTAFVDRTILLYSLF